MSGHVHNELNGGPHFGPVVQAGSIDSVTFVTPGAAAVPVEVAVRDPRPVFESVLANGFTGREWLISRIDDALDRQPSGYVWVEADAGMGKTALVAHLARERDWISHFARYSGGGAVRAGLRNLAGQLIIRHELWHLAPSRMIPEWACTPEGFEALLAQAAKQGNKIVLLVDGADEATTEPGAQPWGLPNLLPPGVFVVGTYRTGSPPPRSDAPRTVLRLSAEDEHNRRDLLDHLNEVRRESTLAGLPVDELAARCGGVWVYLRYVLDEIRLGLRRLGDLDDLPGDLRSFYLAQLTRWRDDEQWHDGVLPLVATLAAVGEALSLDALAHMSGADPRLVERWCHGRLRPFLAATATSPRRFEIYHASLREVLTGTAVAHDEEQAWSDVLRPTVLAAHHRIADQCLTTTDGYALRHLATHLVTAGRFDDMDTLLCKEDAGKPWWFTAHEGESLDRYVADLEAAHAHHAALTDNAMAAGQVAPSLSRELRYLLMIASITSLTNAISTELLCAVTATGLWSPQRTINHCRRLPTPHDRVRSLAAVLPDLPPTYQSDVLAEALATSDAIDDDDDRCVVLAKLAPYLTTGQLDQVLTAALAIADEDTRRTTLTGLARYLSTEQCDRALPVVAALGHPRLRDDALLVFAPHLSPERRADALAAAMTEGKVGQARTLAELIGHLPDTDKLRRLDRLTWFGPYLSPDQIVELHTAIDAIRHKIDCMPLLARLVPYLPAGRRAEAVAQIHDFVSGLRWSHHQHLLTSLASYLSEEWFAEALSDAASSLHDPDPTDSSPLLDLVPHLPPGLLATALEMVEGIHWDSTREEVLVTLAPLLPAADLAYAVDLAESISDRGSRSRTLLALAARLPTPEQRRSAVAAAFAAANEIGQHAGKVTATAALLPHLPDGARQEVLARSATTWLTDVQDNDAMVRILAAATPYLTVAQINPVLTRETPEILLTVARHGTSELRERVLDVVIRTWHAWHGVRVLAGLAPLLPPEALDRALAAAHDIDDDDLRGRVLSTLAPHLPAEQRPTVVADALAALTTTPAVNVLVLRELLPHLPADQLPLAVDVATRGYFGEAERAALLSAVTALLPEASLPQVRAAAVASLTKNLGPRAAVLASLARRAPPDERATAFADVLTEIEVNIATGHGSDALRELGPYVPVELHERVLAITGRIANTLTRAVTLRKLTPHLAPHLIPELLAMTAAIGDDHARAHVLTGLVARLPADQRPPVIAMALAALAQTTSKDDRDRELAGLAPYLPADQLTNALAVAPIGHHEAVLALLATAAELSDHRTCVDILRRALRSNGRPTCLEIITGCLPTLRTITGPDMGVELRKSLDDIHRWWP